jgi:hypothetical protein
MQGLSWLASLVLVSGTWAGTTMPPAPIPDGTVMTLSSCPVPLYECVKYRAERNIHPCAVEMVVAVPNPCKDPCNACQPDCVFVKICVPPCECYETKCKRSGRRLVYDFGKYSVSLTTVRDTIVVAYSD